MTVPPILVLITLIVLAIVCIIATMRVACARLRAFVHGAPVASLRAGLTLEILFGATLIMVSLGVARQLVEGRPLPGAIALWPLVGLPASVGAMCVGVWSMRAPGSPASGGNEPRHHALWLISALVSGAITVLLILAGRLVLTDALLILVAAPAWMWMVSEWRPAGRVRVPGGPPTRHPAPRNPGPVILLLAIPLAVALLLITVRASDSLIPDLLAGAALLALLGPLALAASSRDLTHERADWALAPVLLAPTLIPLVALAAATLTHVFVVVADGASRTVGTGASWQVGAAESLASMPYLSGLSRLMTPTLLALALPLLLIALAGVSHRVRQGAGVALILSGIALCSSSLAST